MFGLFSTESLTLSVQVFLSYYFLFTICECGNIIVFVLPDGCPYAPDKSGQAGRTNTFFSRILGTEKNIQKKPPPKIKN